MPAADKVAFFRENTANLAVKLIIFNLKIMFITKSLFFHLKY
jgi:hypothetical protein